MVRTENVVSGESMQRVKFLTIIMYINASYIYTGSPVIFSPPEPSVWNQMGVTQQENNNLNVHYVVSAARGLSVRTK